VSRAADTLARNLELVAANPAMGEDNITAPKALAARASAILLAVGAAGLALTIVGGVTVNGRHALASYIAAVMGVLAISLGALFFHMILGLTNSGWHVSVRRQMENIFAQVPLCLVLVLVFVVIELANGGVLLRWLGPDNNHLLEHKNPYLNPVFFVIRFVVYAAVWMYLVLRMRGWSVAQDTSGDPMLTRRMRFNAGWGLLALAVTSSFAAYDWMMSMDYRFFSTMWGVYYFAGAAGSSFALLVIVLAVLRGLGRLTGAVTEEHFADIGKFMFGFTIFWAYIAYSQYFLIWYSDIPEETFYMARRGADGWEALKNILMFGHFMIPFVLLLFRPIKRSTWGLAAVGVWLIAMQFADMVWVVRPMVYADVAPNLVPGWQRWWIDAVAIIGVLGVYLGMLTRTIASGPLVPLKDPRMHESLAHRNWVG